MTIENVVLVTIDSLRADYRPRDAPTLASIAERGTAFTNAFATGPGTTASFPGILTGTHPLSHGGLGALSTDRPFLARNLRAHGIATAGFHSNPFLSADFNYDVGFDRFEDYQDSLTNVATKLFPQGIEKSSLPGPVSTTLRKFYEFVRSKPRPYERASTITDDAIAWLRTAPDGFFEWIHYMDVHHPCFPPREYLDSFDLGGISHADISSLYSRAIDAPDDVTEREERILYDSYRASLRYVDDQLERLLAAIEAAGRADETLVVVTSDHGQLFGDHGAYGKPDRLYDALIAIPLVTSDALGLEGASDDLVSLVDLPPLIHHALGLPTPDAYEGKRPNADEPRRHVFAEHHVGDHALVGARSATHKYVIDDVTGTRRAYSVDGDEVERSSNAVPEDLRERALDRRESIDIGRPDYVGEIDDETEGRLQDLGYL